MAVTDTLAPVRELEGVDRARFAAEVFPAQEPVVLRGLIAGWPAVEAAQTPRGFADYLARFDTGQPADTFVGQAGIKGRFFYLDDMRGFNFERRQIPLRATLAKLIEQMEDEAPVCIYSGAVDASQYAPGFQAANPNPLLPDDAVPRLWIGNATKVAAHYDLSAGMACVVRGRRRFTLFPPDQLANLYVGPLEFTMAGQPASMVDLEEPDLERYPRFGEALKVAQTAELVPGDAIFIPTLWWHHVRSFDPFSVLVNYWWGQPDEASPFECLVHGLLAVRDLPERERETWRVIFDHYLFGRNGDAAAHLPDHAKGVLGPASPQRAHMIRQFLLNAISRRHGP